MLGRSWEGGRGKEYLNRKIHFCATCHISEPCFQSPPSGGRLASAPKSPPFCDGVRGEALQVHVLHRTVSEGWAPVSSEGDGARPDSAERHRVHLCLSPLLWGRCRHGMGTLWWQGLVPLPCSQGSVGCRCWEAAAIASSGHSKRPPLSLRPRSPTLDTSSRATGCAQGLGRAEAAGEVTVRRSLRCFGDKNHKKKKRGGGNPPTSKPRTFPAPLPMPAVSLGTAASASGAGAALRGRAATSPRCPPAPHFLPAAAALAGPGRAIPSVRSGESGGGGRLLPGAGRCAHRGAAAERRCGALRPPARPLPRRGSCAPSLALPGPSVTAPSSPSLPPMRLPLISSFPPRSPPLRRRSARPGAAAEL